VLQLEGLLGKPCRLGTTGRTHALSLAQNIATLWGGLPVGSQILQMQLRRDEIDQARMQLLGFYNRAMQGSVLTNRAFTRCALLVFIFASSCDQPKQYSTLHFVETSEPSSSSFESIAHYRYLYDRTAKISRVGHADISPSGQYAAFEDDGKIVLYNGRLKTLKNITGGKFALPEKFSWDESKPLLVIEYYSDSPNPKNHPISTIHLDE